MKLFAIISNLFRKAAVTPLAIGDGWFPIIREPYGGAWQQHVVADAPRDLLSFSPVYACVTRIASDVAKMRPMLVQDQEDGTCVEVTAQSPFKSFLEQPNAYQNHIQFVKHWIAVKLHCGNTYVLKERDGRGLVRRGYILDPDKVKVLVTDSGDVYYSLSADNISGIRQNVTVPASEIIHDRMTPLFHPLCGISPLYAAAMSATMGGRIQRNSTRFFQNMSHAGGALVAPGKLDDEDAKRLKREWEQNFGGDNVGRTAVLANGLKFEPMSKSPQESLLVDQLKWTVEDVARCYGVPLYKLGSQIPQNTSVEELNNQYYADCLQILIEELELCLKEGLGLPAGMYVELDLEGLLRMDTEARVKSAAEAVKAGFMSPNEARRKFNLPPVDGGETPYLQEQNWPLKLLANREIPERAPTKPEPIAVDPEAEERAAAFIQALKKGFEEVA